MVLEKYRLIKQTDMPKIFIYPVTGFPFVSTWKTQTFQTKCLASCIDWLSEFVESRWICSFSTALLHSKAGISLFNDQWVSSLTLSSNHTQPNRNPTILLV